MVTAASPDERTIEKIVEHRKGESGPEFRVRWENYGPRDDTWEPLKHFFPQFNEKLVDYCAERGLNVSLREIVGRRIAAPPAGQIPPKAKPKPAPVLVPGSVDHASPEVIAAPPRAVSPVSPPSVVPKPLLVVPAVLPA